MFGKKIEHMRVRLGPNILGGSCSLSSAVYLFFGVMPVLFNAEVRRSKDSGITVLSGLARAPHKEEQEQD